MLPLTVESLDSEWRCTYNTPLLGIDAYSAFPPYFCYQLFPTITSPCIMVDVAPLPSRRKLVGQPLLYAISVFASLGVFLVRYVMRNEA